MKVLGVWSRTRGVVRVVFLLLALGLLVGGLVREWPTIEPLLRDIGWQTASAALVLTLTATALAAASWLLLLPGLGVTLPFGPASEVFFVGQLGKYVPGSVWNVVAQMELSREHGVSRSRVAIASVLTLVISVLAALVLAGGTLSWSASGLGEYVWVFALLPVGLVLLHPRVLTRVVNVALSRTGRGRLDRPLTWRAVTASSVVAVASWLMFGLQAALLAVPLGVHGPKEVALMVGAFALSWVAGFLVVVAPAGLGVREACLVLVTAPILDSASAFTVALVSRMLMTVSDLALGALGLVLLGVRRRRSARRVTPDRCEELR